MKHAKTAIRWLITGLYAVCLAIFMPILAVFNFLIAICFWCAPDETRSIFTIWKEIMKDNSMENPKDLWKD